MKVAIVGSRDFSNLDLVRKYVDRLDKDVTVISGGARGVDMVAIVQAEVRGLRVKVIPANWDKYGKGAGYRRNREIVAEADEVMAFWDGNSRGTLNTMTLARAAGKPVGVMYGTGEGQ